ncbi:MAG: hypothetical protein Q9208_002897 [Pyrenodesmia sp. 3 TL-2023]
MKPTNFYPLACLAALLPSVAANTRMPGRTFWENPQEKSCYPSVAVHPDGSKPNGNIGSGSWLGALNDGCAEQGAWKGKNTPGNYMPTYYTINYCEGDGTWRITYYLYFSHVRSSPSPGSIVELSSFGLGCHPPIRLGMGLRPVEAGPRRNGQLVSRSVEDFLPQKTSDDTMG